MHQSPQKHWSGRRDKYGDLDAGDGDGEADRRAYRTSQPKARKYLPRDDDGPPRGQQQQQQQRWGGKGPR